jgi:hypothetical protein
MGMVIVMVTGCGFRNNSAKRQNQIRLDHDRKAAWKTYKKRRIHKKCSTAPTGARCGYVYPRVYKEEYVAEFRASVCREELGSPMSDACAEKLADTFITRLVERYTAADVSYVGQRCRAYPIKCQTARWLEERFRRSHNKNVKDDYYAALERAENAAQGRAAKRRKEDEEQRRRTLRAIAAGMQESGRSMQGTNCTSTKYGNTVRTRCN